MMKKIILLLTVGAIATTTHAQYHPAVLPQADLHDVKANKKFVAPLSSASHTANKTTAGDRWYNAAENTGEMNQVDIYDPTLSSFFYLWQDSSVHYPAPSDDMGISYNSLGMVFKPSMPLFNDPTFIPSNLGKTEVTNSDAFTVDSVEIVGFYNRQYTTYVDTLIFTFITETATAKYAKYYYPSGTVKANHGVDTFYAQLYDLYDFGVDAINQLSYGQQSSFMTGQQIKVPMDDALFADSLSNGTHVIGVAPNYIVPAGGTTSVTISFKSGTNYTAGSTIDNYNSFIFLSHETVEDGYVQYYPDDLNLSSICTKFLDTVDATQGLGIYIPTIAYTNLFAAEMHNISWKVSCATCGVVGSVGVNDVHAANAIAKVYPNPANTNINVAVTVSQNASVEVSLVNTLGQIIATNNLGQVNKGQASVATFDTEKLPSGVYMYSVLANGERTTGRVVIAH